MHRLQKHYGRLCGILHVGLSDGLDVVEIENGDQDEGGEAGVEAAVVKDEAAVHLGGYGADDRAHKAGEDAVAEAVLAGDRTKSGGECQAVDVGLGGEGPGDVKARDEADNNHQDEQRNVANHYREDVFDMLAVGREGKGGEYDARGRAGKANAIGQAGNDGGDHEHEIQIREHREAVYGNIDHTDRHTELVGEIGAVSGTFKQVAVAALASVVEDKSEDKRHRKKGDEKDIHKSAIAVRERVVAIVGDRQFSWLLDAEGAVHKGV